MPPQTTPPKPDLAEQIAAALDWWRMAGVDQDYSDNATEWLAQADTETRGAAASEVGQSAGSDVRKPATIAAPPPPPKIGGKPDTWPETLEEFASWWLAEPSLAPGDPAKRVAPRGSNGAELMVLVAHPEAGDSDTLLSGPHGIMLAAMLKAMDIAAADTYVASALPLTMPMPDWEHLAEAGMGSVLARHVGLVQPKRLVVFGRGILPLLSHGAAQDAASVREFLHDSGASKGRTPTLVAEGLDVLLARAPARARFWHRWLDWTK
ncbi:DNA-directed DNA polymerase [Alteripontixanthobacter maritimus]|uniref:DNA-directed DNA polymerase n=2 Tax=Alteripontixanthobacter maritimus TaxID=2161824 RepID=A0A369QA63_9SPHN|nr:DNA-directed DNA polymerase [Alteripontixanthobacter maritimus]